MLRNEGNCDVVLNVGGQEFRTHRRVLTYRSPVFLSMLTVDTQERETGVINMTDADPRTLSDFLIYLYTGIVGNITSENASRLYMMADEYDVNSLKMICLNYMLENISVDNFCNVMSVALDYEEQDLKDACIGFFARRSREIIKTPQWEIFLNENPIIGNELLIRHVI